MMISDVTILISFFNSCDYRLKNFLYLKDFILNLGIPLVVCEQIHELEAKKNIRSPLFSHFFLPIEGCFQKSKLYNFGAKKINTKYIWFLDADVLYPFQKVIPFLKDQEIVRPFKGVHLLNETESNSFLEGQALNFEDIYCDYNYCKHSFIVRKDIFNRSGGFDENFNGWGWEDVDFCYNKNSLIPFDVIDSNFAIHLYHPPAPKINERDNYFTFLENKGVRKRISFCQFIKDSSDLNLENLKRNLNLFKDYGSLVEFCFFFSGEIDNKIIKILKNVYEDYSFISLFHSPDKPKSLHEQLNFSIYPAQGSLICFLNKEHIMQEDLVSKVLGSSESFAHDDLFFCNRYSFNSLNGYRNYPDLRRANLDLKSRLENTKASAANANFGTRESLNFFDFQTHSFISI